MNDNRKIVLLAMVGMSPAVLTETVWALATGPDQVVPDEVVVLTTTAGKDRLCEKILSGGEASVWNQMLTALRKKKVRTEGKLRFGCSQECIRLFSDLSGTRDLNDIATKEDNEVAADAILRTIRSYSENPSVRIYASIAGGRKTMSALMLACMSLLGRDCDHVLHVLVNSPFDGPALTPEFFYPDAQTRTDKEGRKYPARRARIDLIDLPFVKMRGWYEKEFRKLPPSYGQLVHGIQRNAPSASVERPQIRFDFERGCVCVEEEPLKLSPSEFMVFFVLVQERPGSFGALAKRLAYYRARKLKASDDWSQGEWLERFVKGDRFKTEDPDDCTKVMSSLRVKLRKNPRLEPLVEELVPRSKCFVSYPKAKISADVCILHAQFKEC